MLYHENPPEATKGTAASLADLRKDYAQAALEESQVAAEPLQQFELWFTQALQSELPEPNAMHLATVGPDGRPSGRMVLIKGYSAKGIEFYTNYESRKGQELALQPQAALTFFWPELERQIRIEGRVEKLAPEQSFQYFTTRPRLSQVGAWASPQSRPLASREELEALFAATQQRFDQQELPLPPQWGGFRLRPEYWEFWQGRRSRLHDRIVYQQQPDGSWQRGRLAP